MQLCEQYRPRTLDEIIGQDKIVAKVRKIAKRGLAGRAYWISGASGTGKTSIARIIAGEVATEFFTRELDACALTVSDLVDIEREFSFLGWGDKQGKAFIINEAHGLRRPVVKQLLVMLERLAPHVVVIFTTTTEGQSDFEDSLGADGPALISRCALLELTRRDLAKAFADHAKRIAEREGLDGAAPEKYLKLVQAKFNNLRAVLQAIETGEML